MQILFVMVAVGAGLYFLLTRRCFDYFSLAFFSSAIYFLPGFFGITSFHTDGNWSDAPIHPESYAMMIAVMLSICFSAWCAPRVSPASKTERPVSVDKWVANLLLIASCIGLVGVLATSGRGLLIAEKGEILEGLGRWYILFYTAATIGLPVAFFLRRYALAIAFFALLVVDLFLGFRAALSIGVLAILTLVLYQRGVQRLLIANWRICFLAVIFGCLMFGYKEIAFAVKAGMGDRVAAALSTPEFYLWAITRSEPFLVQQTLNEIVTRRFETDASHIYSAVYQLILFAPEMGAQEVRFNSLFQSALFPEVDYGLAANIWAQMWSAGGWPLLLLFLGLFNLVLAVGNATLRIRSIGIRAGLAPLFCYWAFYIHRNDLAYALDLEKRHGLMLIVVVLLARLLHFAASQRDGIVTVHASPRS